MLQIVTFSFIFFALTYQLHLIRILQFCSSQRRGIISANKVLQLYISIDYVKHKDKLEVQFVHVCDPKVLLQQISTTYI